MKRFYKVRRFIPIMALIGAAIVLILITYPNKLTTYVLLIKYQKEFEAVAEYVLLNQVSISEVADINDSLNHSDLIISSPKTSDRSTSGVPQIDQSIRTIQSKYLFSTISKADFDNNSVFFWLNSVTPFGEKIVYTLQYSRTDSPVTYNYGVVENSRLIKYWYFSREDYSRHVD